MSRLSPVLVSFSALFGLLSLISASQSLGADRPLLLTDGTVLRGDTLVSPGGERWSLPLDHTLGTAASADSLVAAGLVTTVDGPRLALARWSPGEAASLLPLPPTSPGSPVTREALPVLDRGGSLRGLAWIDGETAAPAVVYASWEGDAWGPLETVSPPGPGSQLALTAAVSGDGSVVLAWSGFDGEDDEILWARRTATWSPVRRLADDNSVPDITPALTSLTGSDDVWIAWSRYRDGQYRTVVSRLAGSRTGAEWSPPGEVAGAGTLYPSWQQATGDTFEAPLLLLRTALPRGWQLVALDSRLVPRRRAHVTDSQLATSAGEGRTAPPHPEALNDGRPWIEADGDSTGAARVRFRWHPDHPGIAAPWKVQP